MEKPVLNMNLNRGQESLGLIPRFKLAINYCFCKQRRISLVHLVGKKRTEINFLSNFFFLFFVLMRSVLLLASLPVSRYIFLAKPASFGSEDSNLLSGLTFYKGNYLSPQGSLSINKNKQPHYEKDSKTH